MEYQFIEQEESKGSDSSFTSQVDSVLGSIYMGAIQSVSQESQEEQITLLDEHMPGEELCAICYTSELASETSVTLSCGHEFHLECVKQLLSHKWSTLRISFAFMQCPSCKQEI